MDLDKNKTATSTSQRQTNELPLTDRCRAPFQAGLWALAKAYFRIFPAFQCLKVLPATRTCLTQAGARASNTFWHPVLSVDRKNPHQV